MYYLILYRINLSWPFQHLHISTEVQRYNTVNNWSPWVNWESIRKEFLLHSIERKGHILKTRIAKQIKLQILSQVILYAGKLLDLYIYPS